VSDEPSVEKIRAAKDALKEEFGNRAWFRGAGIAPDEHSGLVLRLNVDPDELETEDEVPATYKGVKVTTVFIHGYAKRGARQVTPPKKGAS